MIRERKIACGKLFKMRKGSKFKADNDFRFCIILDFISRRVRTISPPGTYGVILFENSFVSCIATILYYNDGKSQGTFK